MAAALATELTRTGLRAHSEVPSVLNPPAAVIGLGEGKYDDFGGSMTVHFGVLIIVSASNARNAQKMLRDYCSTTGPSSVRTALQVDRLSHQGTDLGVDVRVGGWDPPAVIEVGGIEYLGVEFSIEVVE